jgi:hypothetical protein
MRPVLTWGGFGLRLFLSNLTAVLLVTHAILGCCPHHVQAVADVHSPVRLVHGCRGPEALHCHSAFRTGQCCDERQQREGSSECKCVFSRPAKVRPAKSPPVRFQVVALLVPSCSRTAIGNRFDQHSCTNGNQAAPIRLYLVHQALLI